MSERSASLDVLLVEDNAYNVELARDLLEMNGHRVTVAGDGASFRALLHGGRLPSIVLMDILLPDADGVALLGEMRAEPELARIPVLALTAQALAGDETRFLAAGFCAVVTKPIDTRRFTAEVERWALRGRGV